MANKVQTSHAPVLLRDNQRHAFDWPRSRWDARGLLGLQAGDRVGRSVAKHHLAQEVDQVPGLVLGNLLAKVVDLKPLNEVAQELFLPNDVLGRAGLAHAKGDVFLRRAYDAS